ncbi:MAG: hypothetical protein P1V20_13770, partial [Verrucomicrobiales bacterium]|nr:hypothetical protein [Verrucomicrobiales bacterium]
SQFHDRGLVPARGRVHDLGMRFFGIFSLLIGFCFHVGAQEPWPDLQPWDSNEPLTGTERLTFEGDLSLKLVEMNDAFLDRQIEKAVQRRPDYWKDENAVAANRERFRKVLGLDRDERAEKEVYISSSNRAKWRAFDDVHGYGVLLEPEGKAVADVIYIPDADREVGGEAKALAQAGCRVLVVDIVPRANHPKDPMSTREWLQRPAFVLGRTLPGYEIQKILAAADWIGEADRPLGILGKGEGGLLAFYAGALDERFDSVAVAGYFGPHDLLWKEPADRNLFGLINRFGDAEIARMILPRQLFVTHHGSSDYVYRGLDLLQTRPKLPGKPGVIEPFSFAQVAEEWAKIPSLYQKGGLCTDSEQEWFSGFGKSLGVEVELPVQSGFTLESNSRQVEEIEKHNQWTMHHAAADRKEYWKDLDTRSLAGFQKTVEPYREKFRTDVIGDFEEPRLPFRARTRPYQEGPKTKSYEVVLDVMEGVMAYGILTLPKDLINGEKRPVVVCQHGLEGTPQDVIGENKYKAYKAFATRLAEEGYITFAPQNGYKYFDLFRMQQFKAQSIGKTLFSIIVPQHQQITDWLATQPFVDPGKIAFYGLSYGGKSAMRIPPLVDRYCLSICSADFNDWVWKNAATDSESLRYSYANKGEYEIFEWNLGGTCNYAEMAALIAPRPFMVERGHFDGVAPDHRVALEFAKVRHLYQAKLGIGDRCEIEWFVGPHSINAEGTFRFLNKHLSAK